MNNEALQKLIYLYQDPDIAGKVQFPMHFKAEYADIPPKELSAYFKYYSAYLQKASKFYIDKRDDANQLSVDESVKIIEDIKLYAPYDCFLVQIEGARESEIVDHLLVIATQEDPDGELDDGIAATRFTYHKKWQIWSHDMNVWSIIRDKDTDFSNALKPTEEFVKERSKVSGAGFGVKALISEHLKFVDTDKMWSWANQMIAMYAELNIHLQYPQISRHKDVKGRPNTTIGHRNLKRFTKSEMRQLPIYEHKTLVLDMYDDTEGPSNGGKRSSGTAFHSVRKHIMKIGRGKNKGKPVFRKAHFRGSKDVGVISKDYKITGAPNE